MALNKGGYQLIDCKGENVDLTIDLDLDYDRFHAIADGLKPVYFVNFITQGSANNAVIKDRFEYSTGGDDYYEYEGSAGGGLFYLTGMVSYDLETGEEYSWSISISRNE